MHFIIHIGFSKTGTTAIQSFLANNRTELAEKGFLYPDFKYKGFNVGFREHNLLAWNIVEKISWFKLSPEKCIAQIIQQCKKKPSIKNVILSAESFAGEPHPWVLPSKEKHYEEHRNKVKYIAKLLSGHKVTVIAYLRRQDQWLNSAINHVIKVEGLIGQRLFHSTKQYMDLMDPFLRYDKELDLWADEFSPENIIVAPYDKDQLKNCNIIEDFMNKIGFKSIESFVQPVWTHDTENTRLSRDTLEIKRILNNIPKEKYEERLLIKNLQEISSVLEKDPYEWGNYLTHSESMDLYNKYETFNKHISRKYLHNENHMLFLKPATDNIEISAEYPGLSVEKATEIMLRLNSLKKRPGYYRELISNKVAQFMREKLITSYMILRALRDFIQKFK